MLSTEVTESSPWFEDRNTHREVYRFIQESVVKTPKPIAKHFGTPLREVENVVQDLQMAGFVYRNDDGYLVTLPLDATRVQVVIRG